MNTDHEHSEQQTKQSRWGFRGKTVWDFLQLLIVPLMLVAIGLVFSLQQDARQQRVEDQRAEAERELAEQRAQDEALQAYLNQMSGLLLERDLRTSEEYSEVRTLARARTLTVLRRLDPSRKADVIQFLVEAELVQRADGTDPIIGLSGADLSGANLSEADLSYANLSEADLFNANLFRANLSSAEGITNEQLDAQAESLEGATMPNGQNHEDWLKDIERRKEDEKNSDYSQLSEPREWPETVEEEPERAAPPGARGQRLRRADSVGFGGVSGWAGKLYLNPLQTVLAGSADTEQRSAWDVLGSWARLG